MHTVANKMIPTNLMIFIAVSPQAMQINPVYLKYPGMQAEQRAP
jgi:hypothetical protein